MVTFSKESNTAVNRELDWKNIWHNLQPVLLYDHTESLFPVVWTVVKLIK